MLDDFEAEALEGGDVHGRVREQADALNSQIRQNLAAQADGAQNAARAREGSQARTGRILRAIVLGGQILSDLGIQRIRLLSNTPMHIPALEGFGLEIVEQVAIPVEECNRVR